MKNSASAFRAPEAPDETRGNIDTENMVFLVLHYFVHLWACAFRARLVRVQSLPRRATAFAPELRPVFASLPDLRRVVAYQQQLSSFCVPHDAVSVANDFVAITLAQPHLRHGNLW